MLKICGIFAALVLADGLGDHLQGSLYLATSQVKRATPAAILFSLSQSCLVEEGSSVMMHPLLFPIGED